MLRRAFSRSWSVVLLYLREDRVCLGSNIVSAYKQANWGLCCFVPIDFLRLGQFKLT